jgi:hypothetical protein
MSEFNGEFGWKDVTISVEGQIVSRGTGCRFKEEIERELIYGKGNKPIDVNDGNVKFEGELKMHQSELAKMILLKGDKGVRGLRDITIVIAYAKGLRVQTRTLIGCAFSSLEEAYNQNDKFAEVSLPFIFIDIIYA